MKNKNEKEEIALAISLLKKNGINVKLPEELYIELNENILFEGNDVIFKKYIKQSKNYLEYGSGKSTVWTAKNTKSKIYSIETDPEWVTKTLNLLDKADLKKVNLKYIDIGKVGHYGRPFSFKNHFNFTEYTNYFWDKKIKPDFILIDGRFRVCSFLTCLKYASNDTPILFDDYIERKYYHIVEKFIKISETNSRQALFIKESNTKFNKIELDQMINNFRFVVD